MAACKACWREMLDHVSCDEIAFRFVGDPEVYRPIPYGDEDEDWGAGSGQPCHDCSCLPGAFHHLGCDVERCPRCGGQVIGCDCEHAK